MTIVSFLGADPTELLASYYKVHINYFLSGILWLAMTSYWYGGSLDISNLNWNLKKLTKECQLYIYQIFSITIAMIISGIFMQGNI